MKKLFRKIWFLPVVCAALPGIATAGNAAPVVEGAASEEVLKRLERIERKLNNQSLLDLYNQVQALQSEVNKLRGRLDTQKHMLEEMQQRQKDLYADIDKRLQELKSSEQATATDDAEQVDAEMPAADGEQTAATDEPAADTVQGADVAVDNNEARKAYDNAFNLLKNGKYSEATTAFQQFLQKYPDSDFTDNAHYWLGEAHYVMGNFDKAIGAYQQLLNDYPNSAKAPHALLKIGYSQQEMGNVDQARQTLENVRSKYADTTAASLARERLQQMGTASN